VSEEEVFAKKDAERAAKARQEERERIGSVKKKEKEPADSGIAKPKPKEPPLEPSYFQALDAAVLSGEPGAGKPVSDKPAAGKQGRDLDEPHANKPRI